MRQSQKINLEANEHTAFMQVPRHNCALNTHQTKNDYVLSEMSSEVKN